MDTPIVRSAKQREVCVGVVGVGRMGHAFAQNLLADGYNIIAYARDSKRVRDLLSDGGRAAVRLEDLASRDTILSSLPDDAAPIRHREKAMSRMRI
jgi:3-hydroxyisobutyrate dehydrogenase-like beta-hydroxyacid dehydrogenase